MARCFSLPNQSARPNQSAALSRAISLLTALILPLAARDTDWPEPTADARPKLLWHADQDTPTLEDIAAAGFGGVEITTRQPDPDHLATLAPRADQLGLTFDLHTRLPAEPGAAVSLLPVITTHRGGPLVLDLSAGTVTCLAAWPNNGPPLDLLPFLDPDTGVLTWEAPAGPWRIFGTVEIPAAPALDPFSAAALAAALEISDNFIGADARTLDVAPIEHADWTPDLFPAFQRRRGYDLREQLPALFGEDEAGTVERVVNDYRETLADLQREALTVWHGWSLARGSLSRSRIQTTTGRPLDLHTVAEIPGAILADPADPLPIIFAASAARLTGKPYIAATALRDPPDPARLTPAMMKETVDTLWLAGANQLDLDGLDTATGTPLGPATGRWRELRAFTAYITRVQSILQTGAPDPEVLLYHPAHDAWTEAHGIPGFHGAVTAFRENGIPFTVVSDRLLADATVENGRILIGGLLYQTLVLPDVRRLPEATATRLSELTRRGARLAILGQWPRDVPGYPMPDIRRGTLFTALQSIPSSALAEADDPIELLAQHGVLPEPMTALGLRCVRRSHADGHHYFIVNRSDRRVDAWIPLAVPFESAVLLDPRFLRRTGLAPVRDSEIRLTLEPGESRILRTFRSKTAEGPAWNDFAPAAAPLSIAGTWTIEFLAASGKNPVPVQTPLLGSWKTLADPDLASFTGTARYSIDLEIPAAGRWLLDLGEVAHAARVLINGSDAGSAFAPPHQFEIGRLLKEGTNTLAVEVTALPNDATLPAGLLGPVRLIPLTE